MLQASPQETGDEDCWTSQERGALCLLHLPPRGVGAGSHRGRAQAETDNKGDCHLSSLAFFCATTCRTLIFLTIIIMHELTPSMTSSRGILVTPNIISGTVVCTAQRMLSCKHGKTRSLSSEPSISLPVGLFLLFP